MLERMHTTLWAEYKTTAATDSVHNTNQSPDYPPSLRPPSFPAFSSHRFTTPTNHQTIPRLFDLPPFPPSPHTSTHPTSFFLQATMKHIRAAAVATAFAMLIGTSFSAAATAAAADCGPDDDAAIAAIALSMNVANVNGCSDINVGLCNDQNAGGNLVRLHCCATCDLFLNTPPETSLPPADDTDPVHLVLLGGQSDCTGRSKIPLSNQESARGH